MYEYAHHDDFKERLPANWSIVCPHAMILLSSCCCRAPELRQVVLTHLPYMLTCPPTIRCQKRIRTKAEDESTKCCLGFDA